MSHARFLVGDVFARMADLEDGSVDLVMTSPPFLALRSYLPDDHPDKGLEIGSEPDPATFIDTLLALTAEWERLLAPHGSICVELGDTYSGSGGAGGDYSPDGLRDGQGKFDGSSRRGGEWPMAKSICGIPWLYSLSLAYGRNLLTGEPSPAGMWRVRNVVAWCRPNPPVGALGDKYRPATSYLTIATKATDRWFDLDAVRSINNPGRMGETHASAGREQARADVGLSSQDSVGQPAPQNPAGAPPLDWWEIPTSPYRDSHYAVFPPALLERPIKSMCPMQVCTVCGEPRRRITGEPTYVNGSGQAVEGQVWPSAMADGRSAHSAKTDGNVTRVTETLGWTDCGHDTWRNGLVLDPFGGSGTTAQVATGLGRDCVLIDIDERNADLARDRVGMFLDIEPAAQPATHLNLNGEARR